MLPKLDVPIYELTLPSNKKTIRFRPFLVKEEKLFLMAAESNDVKSVVDAIKQVIKNCVFDDVDVEEMPIYDIEFLFLNLRARSVSEVVNLKYKCFNKVDDGNGGTKQCNGSIEFDVNLLEIKPTVPEEHNNKIQINDKLGIVMKYPSFELLNSMTDELDNKKVMDVVLNCVDYIYDDESVYYAKDTSQAELTEFLDNLPTKAFQDLQKFLETMPKIRKDLHFKCPKCGYEEEINVEGVQSFFV
jgi:hypothetical protein